MRLRARHLACLLLLLSALGTADAAGLRTGSMTPGARYVSAVLQQAARRELVESPLVSALATEPATQPTDLTFTRTAWTMRAPAAHTASIHALTATRA